MWSIDRKKYFYDSSMWIKTFPLSKIRSALIKYAYLYFRGCSQSVTISEVTYQLKCNNLRGPKHISYWDRIKSIWLIAIPIDIFVIFFVFKIDDAATYFSQWRKKSLLMFLQVRQIAYEFIFFLIIPFGCSWRRVYPARSLHTQDLR